MIFGIATGMVFGIGAVVVLTGLAIGVFVQEAETDVRNSVDLALASTEPITDEDDKQ